jgi:hypothetical protein
MKIVKYLAVLGLVLSVGACQDLEVENLNAPDEARALSEPGDVESLIGSGFRNWFYGFSRYYPAWPLSTAADENSSSWGNYGMQHISSEPRTAFPNETGYSYRGVAQDPWFDQYGVISAMNDGLRAIEEGNLEIGTDGADTQRAIAFAKFMQGLSHGYLALHFDRGFVFTEDMDLESTQFELVDYKAMMTQALKSLDEAIAIANSNSFLIPDNWMEGVSNFSNQDLVKLANSYYARFLAANARTPAERAAVDWQKVITRINAGITADFGLNLLDWSDQWKNYTQRYDWHRSDYKTVGPSDVSGAYQAWLALPVADRRDFDMDSRDQRVQGSAVGKNGTDFTYRATQNHREDRGTYHFSRYHWTRLYYIRTTGDGWDPIMTTSEMDFLKAEAFIRLGQQASAVPLINKTRVARGGLPPATVNGVSGADCVPKMILSPTGGCADLMNTLMYEKRIELYAQVAGGAFWDARGWGILPSGTVLHLPIPALELETLQLPIYTFGGGGEGSSQ